MGWGTCTKHRQTPCARHFPFFSPPSFKPSVSPSCSALRLHHGQLKHLAVQKKQIKKHKTFRHSLNDDNKRNPSLWLAEPRGEVQYEAVCHCRRRRRWRRGRSIISSSVPTLSDDITGSWQPGRTVDIYISDQTNRCDIWIYGQKPGTWQSLTGSRPGNSGVLRVPITESLERELDQQHRQKQQKRWFPA